MCIYVFVSVHMDVCVDVYVSLYVDIDVDVYVYRKSTCIYIYIYIYTQMDITHVMYQMPFLLERTRYCDHCPPSAPRKQLVQLVAFVEL